MEIFTGHGIAAIALPEQVALAATNKNKKIIKIVISRYYQRTYRAPGSRPPPKSIPHKHLREVSHIKLEQVRPHRHHRTSRIDRLIHFTPNLILLSHRI